MARERGPGPRQAIPTHKALTKALRTQGKQAGEEAAIRRIMDRRGVSKAEARAIALRRTAAGKNVAGIQSGAHDRYQEKPKHGRGSGGGRGPTTGGGGGPNPPATGGTYEGPIIERQESSRSLARRATRKPKKRGTS